MAEYALGVYEKFMPDTVDIYGKLLHAKQAGYDFLEISVDESDGRLARLDWTKDERKAIRTFMWEAQLPIKTMCLSAHRKYPLGSADRTLAARSLDIMKKAIELASDLGICMIQLAGYDVYYEPSTPDTVSRFARNLESCVKMAAQQGVLLGFETMETPFMNTVSKAMTYVGKMRSPWLQVYPDIGNLTNGTDDVCADLRRGEGHIAAAHLKETRPGIFRDLFPGEGRVDFPSVIDALKKQKVRLFTAECWYRPGDDWEGRLANVCRFYRQYLDIPTA